MATTPCPDRDQLLDYLLGKLPDDISDQIATHLDECPTCESAAETLDQVSDTMVSELNRPLTPSRFESEPQYQEALQRVLALAGAESGTVGNSVRTLGDVSPDLGQLGEYRLLEKLGEGGMGAVYKAQHTKLDKLVALKVLPKDRMQNSMAVSRFEREMKAVGRLNHPHIVQAHDAREIDGTHFLAMEYVEGLDLAKLVSQTGPLRVADACELVRQAAVGLQYAHEQGLVHRDIKPSNLMLSVVRGPLSVAPARAQRITDHGQLTTDHGQQAIVKILDLGLALLGTNESNRPEMTAAGTAMGTADYVSPEQVADSHSVDIRSDIYSLGCTLYKLLSGRAPFVGPEFKNDVTKMMAHVDKVPPRISLLRTDLPPGLASVIERMMAKNPEGRFATPGDVATALEPFAVGCDLGRLLNEASGMLGLPPAETPRSVDTDKLSASVHLDTDVRQVPAAPQPQTAPARGWPPRSMAIGLATVAAGFLFVLLGVIVIRIRDKSGRETVITLPEDSQVAVEQNGKPLFDSGKTADEKLAPAPPAKPAAEENRSSPPTKPAALDKEKPFILVRAGGSREEFKHVTEALAVLQAGDAVEVHGNGPFHVPPVRLDKGLVLRAAPGYRPRFVLTMPEGNRGAVDVRGPLMVEGCDFFSFSHLVAMFSGGGGPCEFRACRCFYRSTEGNFLNWSDAPSVCVRDCLILNVGISTDAKKVELLNNIILLWSEPVHWALMCGLGQTIRLIQNTIVTDAAGPNYVLAQAVNDVPAGALPTTVEAVGNIFYPQTLVHSGLPAEKQKDALAWRGRNNLFVGTKRFLTRQDPQGTILVKDFAGWKELWGGEEGSRYVERVAFQAAVLVQGTPEAALAWLEERVAAIRRQLGPKLKDFGPQWDLIGPGEAYVRALAASGHPVPADQLRPEAPEGGPFVLVRQGKEVRGYPDLQQAVNAVQNGDTVEIRTDGPAPGCLRIPSPSERLAMTLRAAPGYRPVISSQIQLEGGIMLSVEGLDFRDASLFVNYNAKGNGGIVRLANCSFSGSESKCGVGAVIQFAAEDGRSGVHNCFIPCEFCILREGSKVAIHNSILAEIRGGGDNRIELRQSIIGVPSIVDEFRRAPSLGTHKTVTAQGTLFDAVTVKDFVAALADRSWHGAGNVYAMVMPWWPSIEQLRSEWKSPEEGSLEADPAVFDPNTWRLMPGSPGYQEGPDGQDLGADVDRIGVTPPADGQKP